MEVANQIILISSEYMYSIDGAYTRVAPDIRPFSISGRITDNRYEKLAGYPVSGPTLVYTIKLIQRFMSKNKLKEIDFNALYTLYIYLKLAHKFD